MGAGSKFDASDGDQDGRAKGPQIISGDKAKTRIYCEMAKLGHQMAQANEKGDSKKFNALFQRMYQLGKKLGSEYAALIDGLQSN
jgi:hypothetical protein